MRHDINAERATGVTVPACQPAGSENECSTASRSVLLQTCAITIPLRWITPLKCEFWPEAHRFNRACWGHAGRDEVVHKSLAKADKHQKAPRLEMKYVSSTRSMVIRRSFWAKRMHVHGICATRINYSVLPLRTIRRRCEGGSKIDLCLDGVWQGQQPDDLPLYWKLHVINWVITMKSVISSAHVSRMPSTMINHRWV